MPTPTARLLDSDVQTQTIIRDHLVKIYQAQYKKFYSELHKRLRHTVLLPDGTWTGPASSRTRVLIQSMKKLKKELTALAPTVAAQTRPLDALVDRNTRAWLAAEAKKAPGYVATAGAASLAKDFSATLAATKVEEKIVAGAYKSLASRKQQSLKRSLQALETGGDVEARVYRGLIGKKGAHAELLERTRHLLHGGMQSGRNFNDLAFDLERNVWGVDFKRTGTHKGVLSAAKRLLRTEYQHAHNAQRYAIGEADPRATGYYISMDPTACPECVSEYSQRRFTYGKDEPSPPPLHPNCHCSVTGLIFAKPKIRAVA